MALLPTLKELADKLIAFVQSDQFKGWIESVAAWLRDELPIAIQKVASFWETELKPALAEWGPVMRDDILPAMRDLGEILGTVLPPLFSLLSKSLAVTAWVFDNILKPPLDSTIAGFKTLYDWMVKVKDFAFTEEGQNSLSKLSGGAQTVAGLANPFVGIGNALGKAGGQAAGGAVANVNINTGSVLSFMDQSALESWLRPLIQQWMGQ